MLRQDSERGGPFSGGTRGALLESSFAYSAALRAIGSEQGWSSFDVYTDFIDLVEAVESIGADLVIASFSDLPDASTDLIRLRAAHEGPLVVLADDDAALKTALRAGATLALRKPFDPEYLALAVVALLSRPLPLNAVLQSGMTIGDITIQVANHTVQRGSRRQVLGPAEWQLFAFLIANVNTTMTRGDLARGAWGPGYATRESEVELYVSRLRRKIEENPRTPKLLLTVRGTGYRLVGSVVAEA